MKFLSSQPSVYLRRYVRDCKLEKAEHVGEIKNVHTLMKGVYIYTIITTPVHWICDVDEGDIICKLSDEQIQAKKDSDEKALQEILRQSFL